jgi:triacylglycerol lipase
MFTNAQQRLAVFGFRGTDNGQDWGKNLDMTIVEESIGGDSFKIHKGFLERYHFISAWFENEYSQVPKDYTILLTGHSLGGAEATIAAIYAAGKLKRKADGVITYGSPKVGTNEFKQYYEQNVGCDRTIRMTVRFDPAPSFPAHIWWYTHVCPDLEVLGKITLNLLYKHNLYGGYQDGIKRKYDMQDITISCDEVYDV